MSNIFKSICIDKRINSFRSFLILSLFRIEHYVYYSEHMFSNVILKFLHFIHEIVYFIFSLNAQISCKATIGDYIRLPHSADGVIISSHADIGNHVVIFHQVTIGINESLPEEKQKITIGDNCYLSAGCKIISSQLGNNVKVGPNAVVYCDLPNNSIWVSQNRFVNPII